MKKDPKFVEDHAFAIAYVVFVSTAFATGYAYKKLSKKSQDLAERKKTQSYKKLFIKKF